MTRSIRWSLPLLMFGAFAARAQSERGAIRGSVKDDQGRILAGVQLSVKNTDIRATSDATGNYLLAGVWPGETPVQVRRLGFEPATTIVTVRAGDTTRADLRLTAGAAPLPTFETNASGTSARMAGFEERRARGGAGFITRTDIERRRPRVLSDILRSVAGVSIKPSTTAGGLPLVQMDRSARSIGSGVCEVQLFVDGHPYPRGNVDDFPPETVEGVEVYRGGAELPAEFRTDNAGCGLIAIWTRDPSLIPRPSSQ
jgi:hypothetical protein